jgi:F0F1-type ATP synthase membrane subunit b/b'
VINPVVFIPLAMQFVFLIGVLVGNGYTTRTQDARDRRQAAVQRDLNAQWRALRELQEAAEEELRWLSKQQAGLVVIDYDTDKEVPAKDQQPPLRPRRPARWR